MKIPGGLLTYAIQLRSQENHWRSADDACFRSCSDSSRTSHELGPAERYLQASHNFISLATPIRRKTVQLYRENPMGILQRGYAAGEITTTEYEERESRIERVSRDSKLQPLSPLPFDQDAPA